MGDVGEWAAVDEDRIVFQRLHEVGREGILEQHGHGAVAIEVAGEDWLFVARVGDNDVADALLQVFEVGREAEDRHDFGGDGDVEAVFAGEAVGGAAERVDDRAERAVVHVHDAAPGDAAGIDAEAVAPVDVVIEQRREQIVGTGDGVEIAGEMEVDVFHRDDLGVAAAGRAAFDAEAGTE